MGGSFLSCYLCCLFHPRRFLSPSSIMPVLTCRPTSRFSLLANRFSFSLHFFSLYVLRVIWKAHWKQRVLVKASRNIVDANHSSETGWSLLCGRAQMHPRQFGGVTDLRTAFIKASSREMPQRQPVLASQRAHHLRLNPVLPKMPTAALSLGAAPSEPLYVYSQCQYTCGNGKVM